MGHVFLRSTVAGCVWLVLVSAAPGYRPVEPVPGARLEVPAAWQEHRRERDVLYTPPRVDYRSRALGYGVRVFVEEGGATSVARRLETLMASYSKANPGLRTDGPSLVEPGLNRASVDYSIAPASDPTVRESGWVMVARLTNDRWLCVIAVMPEAEKARNAEMFSYIRDSVRVF
jgi:hypothetical protein